jgi:hypothetical protein
VVHNTEFRPTLFLIILDEHCHVIISSQLNLKWQSFRPPRTNSIQHTAYSIQRDPRTFEFAAGMGMDGNH